MSGKASITSSRSAQTAASYVTAKTTLRSVQKNKPRRYHDSVHTASPPSTSSAGRKNCETCAAKARASSPLIHTPTRPVKPVYAGSVTNTEYSTTNSPAHSTRSPSLRVHTPDQVRQPTYTTSVAPSGRISIKATATHLPPRPSTQSNAQELDTYNRTYRPYSTGLLHSVDATARARNDLANARRRDDRNYGTAADKQFNHPASKSASYTTPRPATAYEIIVAKQKGVSVDQAMDEFGRYANSRSPISMAMLSSGMARNGSMAGSDASSVQRPSYNGPIVWHGYSTTIVPPLVSSAATIAAHHGSYPMFQPGYRKVTSAPALRQQVIEIPIVEMPSADISSVSAEHTPRNDSDTTIMKRSDLPSVVALKGKKCVAFAENRQPAQEFMPLQGGVISETAAPSVEKLSTNSSYVSHGRSLMTNTRAKRSVSSLPSIPENGCSASNLPQSDTTAANRGFRQSERSYQVYCACETCLDKLHRYRLECGRVQDRMESIWRICSELRRETGHLIMGNERKFQCLTKYEQVKQSLNEVANTQPFDTRDCFQDEVAFMAVMKDLVELEEMLEPGQARLEIKTRPAIVRKAKTVGGKIKSWGKISSAKVKGMTKKFHRTDNDDDMGF